MSPSSANWLVFVGGIALILVGWVNSTGLARIGWMLGGLALALGAVVRLLDGPIALYEAITWLIWLGGALVVGALIKRVWFTETETGPN
jgi:hypothetical protein